MGPYRGIRRKKNQVCRWGLITRTNGLPEDAKSNRRGEGGGTRLGEEGANGLVEMMEGEKKQATR